MELLKTLAEHQQLIPLVEKVSIYFLVEFIRNKPKYCNFLYLLL